MSLAVKWQLAENGEEYFAEISTDPEVEEAIEDMTKWVTSSVVECIEFWNLDFTDAMLVVIFMTFSVSP